MGTASRRLAAAGLLVAGLVSAASAQDTTRVCKITNGRQFGNWWKQSARATNPLPQPWLYHVEGTVSYTRLDGNVDAEMYKGDLAVTLRKKLVTSTTSFSLNSTDQKINITAKAAMVEKYDVHEAIGYDLTPRLAVGAGVMWKRDNSILLVDRYTYYVGGRYSVLTKPPLLLKLGAYVGYEDDSYDVAEMRKSFGDPLFAAAGTAIPEGYDSPGLRLMNNATLLLSPTVAIVQTFDYMAYSKDSDYYHWEGSGTLQVGLVKGLTLVTRYQARYENNLLAERVKTVFDSAVFRGLGRKNALTNRDDVIYTGLTFNL